MRRTELEQIRFDHQLRNTNLLYLGCRVLVLLDLSYQSRFWTQLELWLSVQTATTGGLAPARENLQRADLWPIHRSADDH